MCGNLVVEPGEDCDGFAGEGQACAAAGSVSECRFECADAACPDGWGCGLDGVCRRGGDFAEAPLGPWTYDGVTMDGADVDGDGRVDVIGVGPAGIGARFSSADGRLDDHADLPMRVMGPTAVGDVNADGRADVVAPIDIGMLAYTGSPERRLDAVPFALFGEDQTVGELRVAAVGAVPDFLPITYPVLITDGGMCFVQFCDALGGAVNPPDGFDLAAMFPAVRAELDGGLTGEEMLLASDGNSNLYVYDIERVTTADGDIDRPRLRQTLALPGPARTRPQLMKRDLDNHWDLIIGVDVGGELKVAAAPGNAGGGFDAAAVDTKFDQFQSAGCGSSRMPLVAADFTGDNAIEWVGDLAVCVDLPIFGFVPYAVPRGASVLREAVAVDLNRDGANDLVAAYKDIDGLAVFLGGGGLLFNQTTVVTEFPVHDLRVGDYDGNYIDDVAFVRPAGLAADAGDEVAVLFGSSDGVADGTVRMAAFGTIEDLLPLDLIISLSTLDRATDMLVVSRHPVTGARGGGALFGDPSGRMTSPLIVDGATPLGALIGRFQDPGATETFILRGLPPDSSAHPPFTTFDVIALTNEGEQFRVEGSPQTLSVSGFAPACAIAAAGDFDGDGHD
ncbi:MAG TPA: VCBS repeat-containing protein, partial [Kofleriaceae bacterium]|nr:VCBS repeat-containing protein [Kofleriaceae bacterium]